MVAKANESNTEKQAEDELQARIQKLIDSLKKEENKSVRADLYRALLELAYNSCAKSYSPYSEFPVGAALVDVNGRVFTGCNVESASYGGSICAERTALVKAVSEGSTKFDLLAVRCLKTKDAWPCGLCRQFIVEFGRDIKIIVEDNDGGIQIMTSAELLPKMFGPHQLPPASK